MGLFDGLKKLGKGVDNFLNALDDYEMDYDKNMNDPILAVDYYLAFHNYIDTHINELSVNRYDIYELLAIHDALDEIIIRSWPCNTIFKREGLIFDNVPKNPNCKVTLGSYLLDRLCTLSLNEIGMFNHIDYILSNILNFAASYNFMYIDISKELLRSLASDMKNVSPLFRNIDIQMPSFYDRCPEHVENVFKEPYIPDIDSIARRIR